LNGNKKGILKMLIIIGSKPVTKKVEDGIQKHEFCYHCRQETLMEEHEVREYFTAFFLPIFPIKKGQSVLKCSNCGTTYLLEK